MTQEELVNKLKKVSIKDNGLIQTNMVSVELMNL
jgi:hypothetical protein